MKFLIIFFFLEILQLIYFLNKKRRNILILINTIFQALLSVGAILYLNAGTYQYEVVLWPLLFFAVLNFISNLAISGSFNLDVAVIRKYVFMDILSTIYILFAIYFFFWKLGDAVALSNSGDYLEAYKEAHSEQISFHGNLFEQILVNYISYLHTPVFLYGFCCLARKKYTFGFMIVFAVFVSRYMWATVYSSRTILFSLLMLIIVCFVLFRRFFSVKIQRRMKLFGGGFIAAIVLIIVLISGSRFEGIELTEWIYWYFGRSIITFQDVVYSINQYSGGSIFFSYIIDILPISKQIPITARDTGTNFVPEFARLYEDFGLWFVITLLLPIVIYIRKLFSKKKKNLADYYLLLSYFFAILLGNLYKTFDFIGFVMIVIIYSMLNFFDVKTSTSITKRRKEGNTTIAN